MLGKGGRTKILSLVLLATVLLLGVSPVFAHSSSLSTSTKNAAGAPATTFVVGQTVYDTASICWSTLSGSYCNQIVSTSSIGTVPSAQTARYIYFDVYSGTCASPGSSPIIAHTSSLISITGDFSSSTGAASLGTASGSVTHTVTAAVSTTSLSASPTGTHYILVVNFVKSSSDTTDLPSRQVCEPFTLVSQYVPTPEFPVGMALLLAIALPGILLIRSRYLVKNLSPSVN